MHLHFKSLLCKGMKSSFCLTTKQLNLNLLVNQNENLLKAGKYCNRGAGMPIGGKN